MQGAGGRLLGSTGVFEGLQGVEDHIGSVFGYILPLEFTQLMKRRVHRFLDVLGECLGLESFVVS